jgi:carnitine O-octanoyltransferase
MSLKETLFKSNKSKTFENEESLPSLPVPPLRSTLDTYLDSVRAISTDEEYDATEAIVRNFENGVGAQLQELLLKRAANHKNWVIINKLNL